METQQDRGFLASLFDFSFDELVTPKVIRFLFGLGIICAALAVIIMIITAFATARMGGGMAQAVLLLIFSPLIYLLYVILIRVYLELIMVIFQIADNTEELAMRERPQAAPPTSD